MRGRALTPANNNLNFIFWRLRIGRPSLPVRRPWLRRARLLLNQVDWLTPAERHEISCVWSQPDCHLIDSPALRTARGRASGMATMIAAALIEDRAESRKVTA